MKKGMKYKDYGYCFIAVSIFASLGLFAFGIWGNDPDPNVASSLRASGMTFGILFGLLAIVQIYLYLIRK